MSYLKRGAVIVPALLEPNGKFEKFNEAAKDPKVKELYKELLKEHKCNPEELGKKLREITWGKKSVDEIASQL